MNEEVIDGQIEVISSGAALESITRAEVDIQISTARKFPRVLSKVKTAMQEAATMDEDTAASCFYTLPRGGKSIQGPSVRLAEIALSAFGNVKAATRILSVETSGENPHVVVQSIVHDMQNNVVVGIEKRRRVVGKKSKGGKPDEDDINLAVNACAAIAFRDAVFKVIPQVLVKPVLEAAKRVAIGDVQSVAVKREKVVGRLKQMGAKEENIYLLLGIKKLEEVTLEHLETLIGIGTSIKDGNLTIEAAFPGAPAAEPVETPFKKQGKTVQDKLRDALTTKGVKFEQFDFYLMAEGFAEAPTPKWEDVKPDVAERLLKAVDAVAYACLGGAK